jgi:hypothetical protein
MSSGMGMCRPGAAWVWGAIAALALGVCGCVAAPGSSQGAGSSAAPAWPATSPSPSASPFATATSIGDCCAPPTKMPYALVTARPTAPGASQPAATSHAAAASGGVAVSSQFDEQVVDSNHDGLIDDLILTPTITVPTAGNYVVGAMLFSQSGVRVISAGPGEIPLAAGTQPLRLEFGGTYIYQSGQWGPYTPVVTVSYEGPVTTTIVLEDASLDQTQAYDYMQFQHDRITVDPATISCKPVDTNGDGLFDELDISGTVTVETPGLYDTSSALYGSSPFGQIAADYTSWQLTAGANSFTLVYKGSDIAQSGQDGPYALQYLEVYLHADPMDDPGPVDLKYDTPPYKASQFSK